MKKILALAFLAAALASAQTTFQTITTLNGSVDNLTTQFTLTSATGAVAGSTTVYLDKELANVTAVSNSVITVQRGIGGTRAVGHQNGALVFIGAPQSFGAVTPTGMCNRSAQPYLPRINVKTGEIADCLGGTWQTTSIDNGNTSQGRWRVYAPEPGATAYTSINTSGTTEGATTVYCTEVDLPTSKLLTGIALLNGTTTGTDKHYVILYDSAGNLVANSNTTGVTTGTASTYQQFPFTSTYFAIGPAQYFACFQANGTTDTVRMATTGTNDNILTKGQTGATFGTVPALTVPTTFTTAVGPYVYLY